MTKEAKPKLFKGLCGESISLLSEDPFVPDTIAIPECRIELESSISTVEGALGACEVCSKKLLEEVAEAVAAVVEAPRVEKKPRIAAPAEVDEFDIAGQISRLLHPLTEAQRERVLVWVVEALS